MVEHNHNDCGCRSGCAKCKEVFTVQNDCCGKCGSKTCDKASCCSACGEGPQEVKNEELASECSWFWITIWRNCCQQPVRISPNRFRAFLLENVNFNDFIDMDALNQKICDAVDAKLNTYVTNASFINLQNKVTKNCNDIAAIQQYIANLVIPVVPPAVDLTGYATETWVIQNFYSRTQVNDLIAGLQNQVNAQGDLIANLQEQIDACCNTTSLEVPTADWDDILSSECPATTSTVVTNPDGVPLTISSTGNGVVVVRVNGSVVTSPFVPADGATIEIEVNAAGGTNEVGVVTIGYDNDGNEGVVDGVQYDITCPATGGNTAPTVNCPSDATFTVNEAIQTLNVTGSDADGDTLTYSMTGNPAGLLIDSATGDITGTPTEEGTFTVTVTANDGNGGTTPCTFTITVGAGGNTGTCPPTTLIGQIVHNSNNGAGVTTYGPFQAFPNAGAITFAGFFFAGNDVVLNDLGDGSFTIDVSNSAATDGPQNLIVSQGSVTGCDVGTLQTINDNGPIL